MLLESDVFFVEERFLRDNEVEKCRTSRLIPIVELHECTCRSDAELVNAQLMEWWTRPDVVAVLMRHERSVRGGGL